MNNTGKRRKKLNITAEDALNVKTSEPTVIISRHGGDPGASRRVEAGDGGNPEAKSSVLANAQTRLYGATPLRETPTENEGDHGRIEVHD